jgi:two-component system phosphate regulon sensor histidine kinase PhoR
MPNSGVPVRHLAAATALLAVPSLIAMVALTAIDALPLGHALAAWAAAAAATAWLLRRHFAALAVLRRYIERADAAAPHSVAPMTAGLADAVARLVRDGQAERARAAALAEARDMVVDAVPEPLLLLTRDGRIAGANRAARGLLGAEIAGRDLAEALRHPQILEAAGAVLAGGAARAVEVTLGQPLQRSLVARIAPLPAPAPDGACAILMLSDLTAVRQAERMRADFIANVSHELRTPLASIIGFIETVKGPARDDAPARQRFLEIMEQQAQRMARLVADLLSLARIEQNEHTQPTGRLEVAPVLATVKATLELAAKRRDMTIALDLAADLPDVIGDPDELAQVFQNLIDNAIKYGRSGTAVTVRAWPTDEPPPAFPRTAGVRPRALAVSVIDTGAGIAREHLPRLTERFYRVDVARSRDAGGTGLGLAIVKHIVSRHRGALTVDSEAGKGSMFTIYLPIFDG